MKKFTIIYSILFTICFGVSNLSAQGLQLTFVENSIAFSDIEKELIQNTIDQSEKEIRLLLPQLPKNINVILEIMPRNIDAVGGTTGRAQKHSPNGEVYLYISSVYPGGVQAAIEVSLSYTVFHEFHHLARGWAMEGNKFDQGIDIAMVNEGLAVVFGEHYTNTHLEGHSIPDEVESWVNEILALPKDANYNSWMNQHPDGRMGIGYRSGNYVVQKAMKNSGFSVLELSKLQPNKILELAGY